MTGYDPKVSGPWSDVDERPKVYTPPPRKIETPEEREARITEQRRLDDLHRERIMGYWKDLEGEDATADPEAYALAREIRVRQPTWADSEECGVTTKMVRAALDALRQA